MAFPRNITLWQRAALAVVAVVACPAVASFGVRADDSIEVQEVKSALAMTQRQLQAEREKNAGSEAQRKALVEGLAEAVRVSEEQVVIARETQLKLQAFGIDLFTQDEKSLEQRLLKAVRDLDICQQDLERQAKASSLVPNGGLGADMVKKGCKKGAPAVTVPIEDESPAPLRILLISIGFPMVSQHF